MKRGFVAFVVVILMVFPGTASASEPPAWDEPVPIGADLPSSWFPDIDVDPNGKTRLVWSSSLTTENLNDTHAIAGAVMISEETSTGWTEPADIFAMDGGIASRPMIASDGAWAHLIFRYAPPGAPVRLVYSRAPLGADLHNTHSWSEPRSLSNDESYWAQLRVLPDGVLVVIYNQMLPVQIDGLQERRTALFSRRSTDGGKTWSSPVRISITDDRVARTSLAVGEDGQHLVAAWDVGYDNLSATGEPSGLATAVSLDAGVTWSDPVSITGDYEQSVVATDGDDALLVYRSTKSDRLFYHVSDDGGVTWTDRKQIPDALARPYSDKHNFDKISFTIDGDGRFMLSWVGTDVNAPLGVSVMVATWADGVWTAPVVISSPSEGFAEYPRIAAVLGNTFRVAYFVRDKAYDLGHYTMWIVDGTSDARAIAPAGVEPAPLIVAPPRILPTPAIVAAPTPLPAPAAVQRTAVLNQTPQSITTEPIRLIAVATLGGIAVLLLVAGVTRRMLRI